MIQAIRRLLRSFPALILACLTLTSCSGPALTPAEVAARTREVAIGADKTAEALLPALKRARGTMAVSFGDHPTDAQKATLEQFDLGIANAEAALKDAGPWIKTGEDAGVGKRRLIDALESLSVLGGIARGFGAPVSRELLQGIEVALVGLGDGQ